MMGETDSAALAASTAQGWAYALNTVARPAPEHLEAAQEALTALERADRPAGPLGAAPRWPGVRTALSEALTAARLRVDGGRPEVTVDQLIRAVARLQEIGLVPPCRADAALAQVIHDDGATDRIAELEEALEEAEEEASAEMAELRGQLARAVELRDRFERERDAAQRDAALAHSRHSAAVDAARYQERRAHWLTVLAAFGMNPPGFAEMETAELEREARAQLGNAVRTAEQMRTVVKELLRAGRRLLLGLDEPTNLPDESNPPALAGAVASLADRSAKARRTVLARQLELEGQILAIRDAMPLHEDERAEFAAQDIARRRRIAELEAIVQVRANDEDDVLGRQLEHVRAERDDLARSRDAQAEAMRQLRSERDAEVRRYNDVANRAEAMVKVEKERADRLEAQLREYQEADQW